MTTVPPLHPDIATLSGLHDRLVLPVPASTVHGIRDQIITLTEHMMHAHQEARLAEAIGLPVSRLNNEVTWGAQCMDVLTDALAYAELADMLRAG